MTACQLGPRERGDRLALLGERVTQRLDELVLLDGLALDDVARGERPQRVLIEPPEDRELLAGVDAHPGASSSAAIRPSSSRFFLASPISRAAALQVIELLGPLQKQERLRVQRVAQSISLSASTPSIPALLQRMPAGLAQVVSRCRRSEDSCRSCAVARSAHRLAGDDLALDRGRGRGDTDRAVLAIVVVSQRFAVSIGAATAQAPAELENLESTRSGSPPAKTYRACRSDRRFAQEVEGRLRRKLVVLHLTEDACQECPSRAADRGFDLGHKLGLKDCVTALCTPRDVSGSVTLTARSSELARCQIGRDRRVRCQARQRTSRNLRISCSGRVRGRALLREHVAIPGIDGERTASTSRCFRGSGTARPHLSADPLATRKAGRDRGYSDRLARLVESGEMRGSSVSAAIAP